MNVRYQVSLASLGGDLCRQRELLVKTITEMGHIPIDLTAIGIIVALTVTGILDPHEALQGFANPAVIAVGAMFIISRGMMRTGALDLIGQKIIHYSKGNPGRIMLMSEASMVVPVALCPGASCTALSPA